MATSETDIANIALGWLGQGSIINMSENDDCDRNYDICRDACLEEVDWTFATERMLLDSPAVDSPAYGFAYKLLLPTRVLRVIEVNANKYDWVKEENYILTDQSRCEVRAVVRIEDVRRFTPNFVQALAARLAAVIAPSIGAKSMASHYWQLYGALKMAAQGNDGRQGTNQKVTRPPQRRSRR